jgi:Protein of unknown function (DUF2934)
MWTRTRNEAGNQLASAPSVKPSEGADRSRRSVPTHEEIELFAYRIHVDRGRRHACDLDDWLQAERELMEGHPADPTSKKALIDVGRVCWPRGR